MSRRPSSASGSGYRLCLRSLLAVRGSAPRSGGSQVGWLPGRVAPRSGGFLELSRDRLRLLPGRVGPKSGGFLKLFTARLPGRVAPRLGGSQVG